MSMVLFDVSYEYLNLGNHHWPSHPMVPMAASKSLQLCFVLGQLCQWTPQDCCMAFISFSTVLLHVVLGLWNRGAAAQWLRRPLMTKESGFKSACRRVAAFSSLGKKLHSAWSCTALCKVVTSKAMGVNPDRKSGTGGPEGGWQRNVLCHPASPAAKPITKRVDQFFQLGSAGKPDRGTMHLGKSSCL